MSILSDGAPVLYRLSRALVVRLVGSLLVGLAVVVFVATVVIALAQASPAYLLWIGLAGILLLVVGSTYLLRWAYVVRCGPAGYRVGLVRGAGVREAGWRDVKDAVATEVQGVACVVLRLTDGRTTTIPTSLLAMERNEFVRELQGHLQRGHGLSPLT